MKCYIIDDEEYSIKGINGCIDKMSGLQLIGSNTNPKLALEEIKNGEKPDLVFLDIDMPELNGIEVASLLPKDTAVIFVTAHTKRAYEAFQLDAVDFILKPFDFSRFVKAVNKVQNLIDHNNKNIDRIFVKSGSKNKLIQIDVKEIVQIEASDHYIYIHMLDKKHIAYVSLNEIEDQLPVKSFVRVHCTHVVNIDLISSIEGNQITMINNVKVPLSRSFRDDFLNEVQSRTIKSIRPKYI